MKLNARRPGTSTKFIDATSGEDILQVASDENGVLFMAYHLYDSNGALVAESAELKHCPGGVTVHCADGELLLDIPVGCDGYVQYRLYNSDGHLLTASDGARTQIFPLLRMESVARLWAPNGAAAAPQPVPVANSRAKRTA